MKLKLILFAVMTVGAWAQTPLPSPVNGGGGGGGGASPAGSAVTAAQCWASASTFRVCGAILLDTVTPPLSALTGTVTGTAGNPSGTYYYNVTYLTANGETEWGPASSAVVTGGSFQIALTAIPVSPDARVTGRRIYRGASSSDAAAKYIITTINNNTATTFTDNVANGTPVDGGHSNDTAPILVNGVTGLLVTGNELGHGSEAFQSILIGTDPGTFSQGDNILIGSFAGKSLASIAAFGNLAIGNLALVDNIAGADNTELGAEAGQHRLGDHNVDIGSGAGRTQTGAEDVYIGYQNGYGTGVGTGSQNTYIGSQAGGYDQGSPTSGMNNVGIGFNIFDIIDAGSDNSGLGSGACAQITSGSGNVCIGKSAGPTTNVSNKLFIDTAQTDTPLIGGDFSAHSVTLFGGTGTIRATYHSADDTAGATVTTCTGFKNGLCVSGT